MAITMAISIFNILKLPLNFAIDIEIEKLC
jgi:hypothetical protein